MKNLFAETTVFIQSQNLITELIKRKAIEEKPMEKMADAFFGHPVYLDPKLPPDEIHIVAPNGKRQIFKFTNDEGKKH